MVWCTMMHLRRPQRSPSPRVPSLLNLVDGGEVRCAQGGRRHVHAVLNVGLSLCEVSAHIRTNWIVESQGQLVGDGDVVSHLLYVLGVLRRRGYFAATGRMLRDETAAEVVPARVQLARPVRGNYVVRFILVTSVTPVVMTSVTSVVRAAVTSESVWHEGRWISVSAVSIVRRVREARRRETVSVRSPGGRVLGQRTVGVPVVRGQRRAD